MSTKKQTNPARSSQTKEGATDTGAAVEELVMENSQEGTGSTQTEAVMMTEENGVVTVTLNDPTKKVNTLGSKLMPEFAKVLAYVESNSEIKAMILISGKPDCFVAGADIEELQACATAEEAATLSKSGQDFLNRLEKLKIPVIAAIDGSCLGGGLELALACSYRIANDSKKTTIGLPEVMLGLLPGAGGTQRLPKLIGLEKALNMILTGASVNAKKALSMGLVDHVVNTKNLLPVAKTAALALAAGRLKPKRGQKDLKSKLMSSLLARKLVLSQARKMILKKTNGLYPAPLAILDVIDEGLDNGFAKGLAKESKEFGNLSQTKESKALVSIYFAQTELKKNPYGSKELKNNTIGVIGAGLMGAGIGLVSVQKGMSVRLKDLNEANLARGEKYVWKELESQAARKKITQTEAKSFYSKLFAQTDWSQFDKCGLVIEAVFEDLDLKRRVLKEVEAVGHGDLVFASNTSALPIAEIAKASSRPENVLGMHYFSPVHKMPLLEIVKTPQTSKEALGLAVAVGQKQGKTVIVVGDGPGFYTTRILVPLMDEAAIFAIEGVDFHLIDKCMRQFGFPVGPITLMDEVGLDVAQHITHDLGKAFGKRICTSDASVLAEFSEKKALGRKTGRGFFVYGQKKTNPILGLVKGKSVKTVNPEALEILRKIGKKSKKALPEKKEIQERTAFRMLNESAYCLQDGILSRPLDGDVGAIFGLGFPPFLGGPFRYMDQLGLGKVVDTLKAFEQDFGERFRPCDLLLDMAKSNKRFY